MATVLEVISGGASLTSGSPNLALTTNIAINPGDLILVLVGCNTNRSVGTTAVTDSASNTYTRDTQKVQIGQANTSIFRSLCTTAVPAGGTITIATTGGSAGQGNATVLKATRFKNAVDAVGSGGGASGDPSVSITTVALYTLTVALSSHNSGVDSTSYVEDSDFTTIGGNFGSGSRMFCAYRLRNTAGADTWAPDSDLNVGWAASIASYAMASDGNNLPMTGAP